MPTHLYVDAKSVYAAATATFIKTPAEKSLLTHVQFLREYLDYGVLSSIVWIDTRDMSADGLTKGAVSRDALQELMTGEMKFRHTLEEWHCRLPITAEKHKAIATSCLSLITIVADNTADMGCLVLTRKPEANANSDPQLYIEKQGMSNGSYLEHSCEDTLLARAIGTSSADVQKSRPSTVKLPNPFAQAMSSGSHVREDYHLKLIAHTSTDDGSNDTPEAPPGNLYSWNGKCGERSGPSTTSLRNVTGPSPSLRSRST